MRKRRVFKYSPEGYFPYGAMQDLFESHAPVKMAAGTYDAGKTFGCVAYMDLLAQWYPGSRLTFVHRSLNRVYRNIIPTYEKYLGYKPTSRDHPKPTEVTRYGGEKPEFFEYGNGTRIWVNGLDQPNNLLSDFFDGGFVNQAELVPFDAWDELTARVSERAGTMPIATLVGDCNPSVPHHWIRQQTKDKKLAFFKMSFLDNPEIISAQKSDRLIAFKRAFENSPDPKLLDTIMDMFSPSGLRRVEKLRKRKFLRGYGSSAGFSVSGNRAKA